MADPGPTRSQGDLAEMLDTLLDKGVVINADVAVSVGDTELLGIELRAAVASFETAAEYGLAFPAGTDVERVRAAAGVDPPGVESGDGDGEGDDNGGNHGPGNDRDGDDGEAEDREAEDGESAPGQVTTAGVETDD